MRDDKAGSRMTDVEEADTDEIEVTEEMIAAGVDVLYELEGDSLKERLAETVFRAMLAASPACDLEEGDQSTTPRRPEIALREVLTRARSVLRTCLNERPEDLAKPARRSVIERRMREITDVLTEEAARAGG